MVRSTLRGKTPLSSRQLSPGIPGYKDWAHLETGGYSTVYAATRERCGTSVAIKIGTLAAKPSFIRERKMLARVEAHVAPRLLEHGEDADGHPYLVMEKITGTRFEVKPTASVSCRMALAQRLCEAVARTHSSGVIHCDLKPSNIIVGNGRVTIIDFGCARRHHQTVSQSGTVAYRAPELLTVGCRAHPAVDIYSLGVILYELFCGVRPFSGSAFVLQEAHVSRRPTPPSQLAELPAELDEVILDCLAKRADQRHQSVGRLSEKLVAAGGQTPRRNRCSSPAKLAARPRRRRVALLATRWNGSVVELGAIASRYNATLVWCDQGWQVMVFPNADSPTSGVRSAINASTDLTTGGGSATVHLDELLVHRFRYRTQVSGSVLSAPESWASHLGGIKLTHRAARLANIGLTQKGPNLWEPTPQLPPLSKQTRFIGRDHDLEQLLAEAKHGLTDDQPVLSTVIGHPGYGKSRLLDELSIQLPRYGWGQRTQVVVLRAIQHEREALLRSLLEFVLAITRPVKTVSHVRTACHRTLGYEKAETTWPAVALAFGIIDDDHAAGIVKHGGGMRAALVELIHDRLVEISCSQALALFIDDAQWADQSSIEAIERVAQDEHIKLWICLAARPEFIESRPYWGDLVSNHRRHQLTALHATATRSLIIELLSPVEFVADAVVSRLTKAVGGVPLLLHEIAHSLRRSGGIRRESQGWVVAADELSLQPHETLLNSIAASMLRSLPLVLHDLLQVAAVAGPVFGCEDIAGIQREIGRGAPCGLQGFVELDAIAGLNRLASLGALQARDSNRYGLNRYGFTHSLVADCIECNIPTERRRLLHEAAWRYQKSLSSPNSLERVAHHAALSDHPRESVDSYLQLAEQALGRHQDSDAERYFTAALIQLDTCLGNHVPLSRLRIHMGRGRVRYRLQRVRAAIVDLRKARSIASQLGNDLAVAELMLEEATALDWIHDWVNSAKLVDKAKPIVAKLHDHRLTVRLLAACGRIHWRREQVSSAIEVLTQAASEARLIEDWETAIVSMLLLAPALGFAGRWQDALNCYDTLIERCRRDGDWLHLGGAYCNRMLLWVQRRQPERALIDLRRAIEMAQTVGHYQLERVAQYNLAELYYWNGDLENALTAARRARELQLRYQEPTFEDTLLVSRILTARGEIEEATQLVVWLRERFEDCDLAPSLRTCLHAIEEFHNEAGNQEHDPESWFRLITEAKTTTMSDELLEVLWFATRAAQQAGHFDQMERWYEMALDRVVDATHWQQRFSNIINIIEAGQQPSNCCPT